MRLDWHDYRYYPYERDLAAREIASLLGTQSVQVTLDGVELACDPEDDGVSRLTYFARAASGSDSLETVQSLLERTARSGKNRQATRYSVHGLHEYKGKFNPQVAKALLNIFRVQRGQCVLDPFCGSGTTLVECAHLGATGIGLDINPFAVFLAGAKLQALGTPAPKLWALLTRLSASLRQKTHGSGSTEDGPRRQYLASWFTDDVLETIEMVRIEVQRVTDDIAPVFLAIASDLLRDYSLQDPRDLRIRRRVSPLPETPFVQSFLARAERAIGHVEAAQAVLGVPRRLGHASLADVSTKLPRTLPTSLDAAITSPPYAMALPYIDTQRLSLVWLGLVPPERVLGLEAALIGSREFRGRARRNAISALQTNDGKLPEAELSLCRELDAALGKSDGFRRRAVPSLLYRYFTLMKLSFKTVREALRPGAPFGLVVGSNHTTIGGVRREINTPLHLARLARSQGWTQEELIPLQTYRRYGYHVSNAVRAETLVLLRKP